MELFTKWWTPLLGPMKQKWKYCPFSLSDVMLNGGLLRGSVDPGLISLPLGVYNLIPQCMLACHWGCSWFFLWPAMSVVDVHPFREPNCAGFTAVGYISVTGQQGLRNTVSSSQGEWSQSHRLELWWRELVSSWLHTGWYNISVRQRKGSDTTGWAQMP